MMEDLTNTQKKPTFTFVEAVSSAFKNYANFTGRARRSEYWWFWLFSVLIFCFATFLDRVLGISSQFTDYGPIYAVILLALLIPTWSVMVRRLHDINKSGLNLLWILVPLVGIILVVIWFCKDSDKSANNYGESPKYVS